MYLMTSRRQSGKLRIELQSFSSSILNIPTLGKISKPSIPCGGFNVHTGSVRLWLITVPISRWPCRRHRFSPCIGRARSRRDRTRDIGCKNLGTALANKHGLAFVGMTAFSHLGKRLAVRLINEYHRGNRE